MAIVKASKESEAGVMPKEEELAEMGRFNEELVKAGIMLAGDGLHPSAKGKRVVYGGAKPTIVDGPFAETSELIAGYWIWQVRSMDEAMEWARRAPFGPGAVLELRPIFDPEDFGEAYTPEIRAQEDRIREQLERQQRA
jgi:hypothetical protein